MREHRFRNDTTLIVPGPGWNIQALDLGQFPVVVDFQVELTAATDPLGPHLYFYSPRFGVLANFPWWDGVVQVLQHYRVTDIPLGTLRRPYWDLEQGWIILIFETSGYVYVMQGDFETKNEFYSWFRVTRTRYVREWIRTIKQFNSAMWHTA